MVEECGFTDARNMTYKWKIGIDEDLTEQPSSVKTVFQVIMCGGFWF